MSRPVELPKVLTRAEVTALMAAPNLNAPTGLRNRCMLEVMHRLGLRVSECCGLHVRDVEWDDGQVHLRAAITKGEVEAWLPIDARTLSLLEQWKRERRRYAARKPHLFTTLTGGPVGRKYVWAMMQRYARRAGLETHVYPHILRHTFGTELLREGFDLREVQHLMRHADVRTTTVYTHIAGGELHRRMRERD
jgi:integrase/recombinase XerD